MKLDFVRYGLQSIIGLFFLLLASLYLQISSDVVLYDTYGIQPTGETNFFLGTAIVVCFFGLILAVVTYRQYRKRDCKYPAA
ncbi:MAG: hypothetical protein E4G74_01490 [Erysipelotrichales bacterium]|nr:MAG: hypothetical protein E4G74_01490 [Erysipelotrichales bacterium]